jgi:hypothetical protein
MYLIFGIFVAFVLVFVNLVHRMLPPEKEEVQPTQVTA